MCNLKGSGWWWEQSQRPRSRSTSQPFLICEQTARRKQRPDAKNVWKSPNEKISSFFGPYWGGRDAGRKKNADFQNGPEQSLWKQLPPEICSVNRGHILPVMNSEYMWYIRVALMAQLCHKKIEPCTHGTGNALRCEAVNRRPSRTPPICDPLRILQYFFYST